MDVFCSYAFLYWASVIWEFDIWREKHTVLMVSAK